MRSIMRLPWHTWARARRIPSQYPRRSVQLWRDGTAPFGAIVTTAEPPTPLHSDRAPFRHRITTPFAPDQPRRSALRARRSHGTHRLLAAHHAADAMIMKSLRALLIPRSVPIALAVLGAALHLLNHPGLYYPDTTNFLREGWMVGQRTEYPVIPPAFTLILDLLCALVPRTARMPTLVVIQQASLVTSVWLVLRIMEVAGRPRLGVVASSLVALYLPLYSYAQTSQSESFFVLFSLACTYATVRSWAGIGSRSSLAAGVLAGLTVAQRTLGSAIVGAIALTLAVGRIAEKTRFLRRFSAGFAAIVLIFIANNVVHHHAPRLVGGTGLHMFGRIAVVDRCLPDTVEARRVQEIAQRHGMTDVLISMAGWRLHPILAWDEGLGPAPADRLLLRVSLQCWMERPLSMTWHTWDAMRQMTAWESARGYLLWGGLRPDGFEQHAAFSEDAWKWDPETLHRLRAELAPYRSPELLGSWAYDVLEEWSDASASLVRGPWVIPALVLTLLVGLWRRHAIVLLTSSAAMGQLVAAALGDAPFPRYWDPAVPFFMMSTVLAFGELADMFVASSPKRRLRPGNTKQPDRTPDSSSKTPDVSDTSLPA